MKRSGAVIAAVLAAVALLAAGCSSSSKPSTGSPGSQTPSELGGGAPGPGGPNGGFNGVGLTPAQPRPSFSLTDTSGAKFAFSSTHGRPTLLYFGYTNCPDVCPTTMYDIGAALRTLPAALQQKVFVVFVTTDVKRDTGPVMKTWLGNFSGGTKATWVGLTGTQAQIDAAQTAAHVVVAEDDGQTHSAQVLLYGPDDYARVSFLQSETEQQAIAHDLTLVAG